MNHFKNVFFGLLAVAVLSGLGAAISFYEESGAQSNNLNLAITVKENAGVGTVSDPFPITVVVPFPKGGYQNVNQFKLENLSGSQIPAQFEAVNRWWSFDSSIRHVAIHFQPGVFAFTGSSGSGVATYMLKDCGGAVCPSAAGQKVNVVDAGAYWEVNTGTLKFQVKKSGAGFNIIDRAWFDQNGNSIFESSEEVISPNSANGGLLVNRFNLTEQDSSYADTVVTVEEFGPMRAVIKAEAPALYYDTTNPNNRHGFAARIYAYAGKSDVKIDYQLKNDAKNQKGCSGVQGQKYTSCPSFWPLYFENMDVNFKFNLGTNPTATFGLIDDSTFSAQVGTTQYPNGLFAAQELHNTEYIYDAKQGQQNPIRSVQLSSNTGTPQDLFSGVKGSWLDASTGSGSWGVTATTRYSWQRWPNGLAVDGSGKLSFQLWPWWSAQLNQQNGPKYINTNPHLHWLADGQNVYKELFLRFHKGSVNTSATNNLVKTVNHYPVGVVPTTWYDQTKATLEGGVIGPTNPATQDLRLPDYAYTSGDTNDENNGSDKINNAAYQFNWVMFRDTDEKHQVSCDYGGWPYAAAEFIVSGNPSDYWEAEQRAMGEINIRPQWVTGYTDAGDYSWLTPQNYHDGKCGKAFRNFYANGVLIYDAPRIPGTETYIWGTTGIGVDKQDAQWTMRDDQHGWWYGVEPAYYYTANPWIRDWYDFVKEAVWGRLDAKDDYLDNLARARGHKLGLVNAAYRVTGGQTSRGNLFGDYWQGQPGLQKYLNTELLSSSGKQSSQDPIYGHPNANKIDRAEFDGYHGKHAVISAMDEAKDRDPQLWAELFNYLAGLVDANFEQLHFCYNCTKNSPPGQNGQDSKPTITGISVLADMIAKFSYDTGLTKYMTDPDPMKGLDAAIQWQVCTNTGNSGGGLYKDNDLPAWWPWQKAGCTPTNPKYSGDYFGRYYLYARNTPKADTIAPKQITDLRAVKGTNSTVLTWTTPNDSDLDKFHIVWSNKPITTQWTSSSATTNWWAASAIGPGKNLAPKPGTIQTYTIGAVAPYAAIFTFDASGNISAMSNVAYASATGNDAQFIAQNVSTTMSVGKTYPVTVTMKNTGTTNWTQAGKYFLGDPALVWGNWVNLSSNETIAPGQTKTFTWNVTAPSIAGTYTFQWQMIQMNVEWFGAPSGAVAVTVGSIGTSSFRGEAAGGSAVEKPGGGIGAIQIKRVGQDLSTASAPPGTVAYVIDAELASSANPATFQNLVQGSYSAAVTDVVGYDEFAGTCTITKFIKNCLVKTFNIIPNCDGTICSLSANVVSGATNKIVFQYLPAQPPPPVDNPPTVTLVSPANGATVPAGNITFTFSATDDNGLVGASLYYGTGGVWQPYTQYNPKLSGKAATASITLPNIPSGITFNWDVLVCDNGQPVNCSFSPSKFTVTTQAAPTPTPPQTGVIELPPTKDAPPKVTLVSPANNATVPAGDITFVFKAIDDTQLVGASLFLTAGGKTLPYNGYQPSLSGKQATASITVSNIPAGITFQWDILVCGSGPKGLQCSYAPSKFTATTKLTVTPPPPGSPGATKLPTPTPTPTATKAPGQIQPKIDVPAAPTDLTAEIVYDGRLRTILHWQDASINEQGYRIYKSSDGANFFLADGLPANSIAWNDFKVSWDRTFFYQIRAWNSAGESSPSNTVGSTPISAPSGLSAAAVSAAQIQLIWTDNSAVETRYVVERSQTGQSGSYAIIEQNLPANTTVFSDTGLSPGAPYWYAVRAESDTGKSLNSNIASAYTLVSPSLPGGLSPSGGTPQPAAPSGSGTKTF